MTDADATGWVKLGMITTDNAMFAIVAPYFAGALRDYWESEYLPQLDAIRIGHAPRMHPTFEEVQLRQITTSVNHPGGYEDSENAFLFAVDSNGGYEVEGRFETPYGEGRMMLAELRVRILYEEDQDTKPPPEGEES